MIKVLNLYVHLIEILVIGSINFRGSLDASCADIAN